MSEASSPKGKPSGGNSRQTVLLVVLVLMVCALLYDYQVARPAVDKAYDQIAEKSMLINSQSTDVLTNAGVKELLGLEPSSSFEEVNGDLVEVYSWRSGLPIRTHQLFTVYKMNDGQWMFHRHSKFLYESSGEVSQHDTRESMIVPSDGASLDDGGEGSSGESEDAGGDEDAGADTGGGRPAAAAAGGDDGYAGSSAFDPEVRARAEPEEVFDENDEDGDGNLSDSEIPQISNQTKVKIDVNKDGVLSKEEWMAEMKGDSASAPSEAGDDTAGADPAADADKSSDEEGDATADSE